MGHFGRNFGSGFDRGYSKAKEIAKNNDENKIDQILEIVKKLETMSEQQQELLSKIASFVIKSHNDNLINNDTFNKLDEFLKPYYDDSNKIKDY